MGKLRCALMEAVGKRKQQVTGSVRGHIWLPLVDVILGMGPTIRNAVSSSSCPGLLGLIVAVFIWHSRLRMLLFWLIIIERVVFLGRLLQERAKSPISHVPQPIMCPLWSSVKTVGLSWKLYGALYLAWILWNVRREALGIWFGQISHWRFIGLSCDKDQSWPWGTSWLL